MRPKTKSASQSKSGAASLGAELAFGKAHDSRQQFLVMVMNMSWQLAIVVLVPIIGGVEVDKAANVSSLYLFVGLAVALVASVLVMWRTMQAANRLPVPKLTAAQKRAIQKSYQEEDDD